MLFGPQPFEKKWMQSSSFYDSECRIQNAQGAWNSLSRAANFRNCQINSGEKCPTWPGEAPWRRHMIAGKLLEWQTKTLIFSRRSPVALAMEPDFRNQNPSCFTQFINPAAGSRRQTRITRSGHPLRRGRGLVRQSPADLRPAHFIG